VHPAQRFDDTRPDEERGVAGCRDERLNRLGVSEQTEGECSFDAYFLRGVLEGGLEEGARSRGSDPTDRKCRSRPRLRSWIPQRLAEALVDLTPILGAEDCGQHAKPPLGRLGGLRCRIRFPGLQGSRFGRRRRSRRRLGRRVPARPDHRDEECYDPYAGADPCLHEPMVLAEEGERIIYRAAFP
jgi:hypothetical protein